MIRSDPYIQFGTEFIPCDPTSRTLADDGSKCVRPLPCFCLLNNPVDTPPFHREFNDVRSTRVVHLPPVRWESEGRARLPYYSVDYLIHARLQIWAARPERVGRFFPVASTRPSFTSPRLQADKDWCVIPVMISSSSSVHSLVERTARTLLFIFGRCSFTD